MQGHAAVGEGAPHRSIAGERIGIVVMVGVDGLDVQLARQGDDLVGRLAMTHDEANAVCPVAAAEGGQIGIERLDTLPDELDASIGPGQGVQDLPVEDEGAPDFARRLQRMEERRLVLGAQVAPKPDQRRVEGLLHGLAVCRKARGSAREHARGRRSRNKMPSCPLRRSI